MFKRVFWANERQCLFIMCLYVVLTRKRQFLRYSCAENKLVQK